MAARAGKRTHPNATAVRSGLPLFHTTRAGRIVEWNAAAEELSGISASEAIGRDCWDVIRGRDRHGGLVCHRGCSIARLAREGWPVQCADLHVRMPSGVDRVTVSTIVVGQDDDTVVLHPMQQVPGRHAARAPAPPPLTPRQREILDFLTDGVRAKEIAVRVGLSVSTVRNHIHALLRQLEVSSQLQAVARARELDLGVPVSGGAARPRRGPAPPRGTRRRGRS